MNDDACDAVSVGEGAAIEITRGDGGVVVIAVEGGPRASEVAAAMRVHVSGAPSVAALGAGWRAGVGAAMGARLSAAIAWITPGRATVLHAGDLAIHAVSATGVTLVCEPHTQSLARATPLRIRTRGINLPPPADHAEMTELDLPGAHQLAVATAAVWAPLADDLPALLRGGVAPAELVTRAARVESALARAVAAVPRACAVVVVPSAAANEAPTAVAVAAQQRVRRAVRARLASTIGSRGVVIVGPRGCGKTTVLEQLGRAGALDASGVLLRAAQVRRAARARAPLGDGASAVLVDQVVDVIGGEPLIGEVIADAIRDGIGFVTTATRDDLARLSVQHRRLRDLLHDVELAEPSRDELIAIATMWSPRLAARHRVSMRPDVVPLAAELAARHAPDRAQPEATLCLLEQACVRAGDAPVVSCTAAGRGSGVVDRAAVIAAAADQAGVPPELIGLDDEVRAAQLADRFAGRLHGQRAATERIAATVQAAIGRRAREAPRRPLASLMLLGPTGTGKSETARVLAEAWFGDRRALTVIDLSEYRDPSSVNRLTGAAPGYVGYGEPSVLASALASRPRQVVLFDELEKSCEAVQLLLLQLLDEGRLSSARGTLDFRDTIVVLTSNLLADAGQAVGFARRDDALPSEAAVRAALEHALRPELIARIDAVVRFEPLSRAAAQLIALGHLARCADALIAAGRLAAAQLPVIRKRVLAALPTTGAPRGGARDVHRLVDRLLIEQRNAAVAPNAGLTIAFPFHHGSRDRLAAGLVIQLADGVRGDEVAQSLITHPAASALMYVVHDAHRVIALAEDDESARELAHGHASYGAVRCATGRVTADLAGRAVGDLVDRLLDIA